MKTTKIVTRRNKDKSVKTACILYAPDDGKFGKIVIFCHGFPGTNRLPELAAILTKNGVALLEVGYQGDTGMGCGGKFSFIGSSQDIGAACLWVEQAYCDIEKQILAYSAGATYALNLAHRHPELLDSLVLLNPVISATLFAQKDVMTELWTQAKTLLYLNESEFYDDEIEKLIAKHNPSSFLDEISTPITIVQSEDDEVLSAVTIKWFSSCYSNQEYIGIPGAKHNLRGDEPELIKVLTL